MCRRTESLLADEVQLRAGHTILTTESAVHICFVTSSAELPAKFYHFVIYLAYNKRKHNVYRTVTCRLIDQ